MPVLSCSLPEAMSLVDLHCHILHKIDDGPDDLAGAIAMARAQVDAGVGRVVATPHVNRTYPNRSVEIKERHRELVDALAMEGVELKVEQGAEVAAVAAMQLDEQELKSLRLGNSRWLLLEPPSEVDAVGIQSMVGEVQRRGHRILLAHPERIEAFRREPAVLEAMVRGGIRTQVTASAINGRFGPSTQRFLKKLFSAGLVSVVSSDAHDLIHRPPGLAGDLQLARHSDLIKELCMDRPTEILDDE